MIIIFDLNKTLLIKYPNLILRPYFKELYNFLKIHKIKIGIWSFCNKNNFKRIINFLNENGFTEFDFLKCEPNDSTKNIKKKDLKEVAEQLNEKLNEIILIEDDENKCVLNQNRLIVKPFNGSSYDFEFKNVLEIIMQIIIL